MVGLVADRDGDRRVFGYRKIDLSAKVLAVLVIAEYCAVLVLDFAIIVKGGDSGNSMVSFTPARSSAVRPQSAC